MRASIRGSMAIVVVSALTAGPALASPKIDWDQVENIKEAATRLGQIQRRQGATKAFEFIIACYKTHGASSKYTRYFEGCIAQDYIHTQTLASLYSRMSPQTLRQARAPSPKDLADAMGKRVSGAFGKYDVPVTEANAFKKLVDKYGFQAFASVVFPKPKKNDDAGGQPPGDGTDPKDNEKKQDAP